MHIILAFLGFLVTAVYLIHRLKELGIDIGWLNPFHWHRRQKWRKKVNADPVFCIQDPMEAAAVLLYTAAKLSGDISAEQKALILDIYEQDFKLSKQDATNLLSSNAFLIKDEDRIYLQLKRFLEESLEQFNEAQRDSTLALVDRVIAVEARVSPKQEDFRTQLASIFRPDIKQEGTWH